MRYVDLSGSLLEDVQFTHTDLTGASFKDAYISGSKFLRTNLTNAKLYLSVFVRSSFSNPTLTNCDMKFALLRSCKFSETDFGAARMTGIKLGDTLFADSDIRALCSARRVIHHSPSTVDHRSILKSYTHAGLHKFLVACGTPPIFATYLIECARAIDEPLLHKLMQSTFISYGGPDEKLAWKIYDVLRENEVTTFFFPETARPGMRISDEVFTQLQRHDRVLLVCSRNSLTRPGVINEIQETLDREVRDGGESYLLPIMLDDYVLKGWAKEHPMLAERIGRRVIADFGRTRNDKVAFDKAMTRVIDALKIKAPLTS